MKNQTVKYTNEPIGKVEIIKDFLPTPDKLIFQEQTSHKPCSKQPAITFKKANKPDS